MRTGNAQKHGDENRALHIVTSLRGLTSGMPSGTATDS
jgi:hypothetical protein